MAEGNRDPVSSTRLYLGNLPPNATKADIENHFSTHGTGEISEIKLMSGFGFIEYRDSMDARDVVPAFHGTDFMGNRLVVQFARGNRPREPMAFNYDRAPPRTRRTIYRMSISDLAPDVSWQDLKDFARLDGLDVVYSEVSRGRDGKGFVEYETASDLKTAVEKIDGRDFKGQKVSCIEDIQPERPRDRFRSRSPMRRGNYYGGPPRGGYDDYYDRPPPPRGYSPGRGYRERSPPPRRDYYESRDRYGRSPPPPSRGARPPPPDDQYARRPYPDEPYPPQRRGYGGPPAPYPEDPYMSNGHRGGYERGPPPASPPRRRTPPPREYEGGYQRRDYW